jgi:hypothetical protein
VSDTITLPVTFEGKEYEFETSLVPFGYLHRLIITVEGVELSFEMDEERNYRVIDTSQNPRAVSRIEPGLLQAIVEKLQSLHA